jgi:hypothetical protein
MKQAKWVKCARMKNSSLNSETIFSYFFFWSNYETLRSVTDKLSYFNFVFAEILTYSNG